MMTTYRVKVIMGDFIMPLFWVIPELRSRGATVDLGAWYPWKVPHRDPNERQMRYVCHRHAWGVPPVQGH